MMVPMLDIFVIEWYSMYLYIISIASIFYIRNASIFVWDNRLICGEDIERYNHNINE